MYEYEVLVELKEVGNYADFPTAFKNFILKIKEVMELRASYQMLETCTITLKTDLYQIPMGFYDCRDLGHHLGLMKEADLADSFPDISEDEVRKIFEDHSLEIVEKSVRNLSNIAEVLFKVT